MSEHLGACEPWVVGDLLQTWRMRQAVTTCGSRARVCSRSGWEGTIRRRYCRGVSAPFWGETPPATRVTPEEAAVLAHDVFGVHGDSEPLGSNQETNLRLRGEDG